MNDKLKIDVEVIDMATGQRIAKIDSSQFMVIVKELGLPRNSFLSDAISLYNQEKFIENLKASILINNL